MLRSESFSWRSGRGGEVGKKPQQKTKNPLYCLPKAEGWGAKGCYTQSQYQSSHILAWNPGNHENFNQCLLDSHGKNWSILAFLLFHVPDSYCPINIIWQTGNKVTQNWPVCVWKGQEWKVNGNPAARNTLSRVWGFFVGTRKRKRLGYLHIQSMLPSQLSL